MRKQLSMEKFYRLEMCVICLQKSYEDICARCLRDLPSLMYLLNSKIATISSSYLSLNDKC